MSRCTPVGCALLSPRRVLALLLGPALSSFALANVPPATLGWAHGADASLAGQRCTVDRRAAAELSKHEFNALYLEKQPVVLTGLSGNERVRDLCARERLLADWVRGVASRRVSLYRVQASAEANAAPLQGEHEIVLSTANTYSYDKKRMSLRQYVADHFAPQATNTSGRDVLYHFGDNNHTEWSALLDLYVRPPFIPADAQVALSFGLAGPGSGVPFHIHGAGYSETLIGRKRWLLYAPEQRPPFDPDELSLKWLLRWQAGDLEIAAHGPPLDCTIGPGEALYFPSRWWHATLNVDESVFVSSFVSYARTGVAPRRAAVELR